MNLRTAKPAILVTKLLENLWLDLRFLFERDLALRDKIAFMIAKYAAIALDRRSIGYLGRPFAYDNRLTPALLQGYWHEIAELDRILSWARISTVVDIGANIGQFAFTIKRRYPHVRVFSFEPNHEVFPLLERNSAGVDGWRAFNAAIDVKAGERRMWFVPGKSAQGSFYEANARLFLLEGQAREITVRTVNLDAATLDTLGIPRKVDLLKIDVEGHERDVLSAMGGLEWDYLYIELSAGREGAFSLEDLLNMIERQGREGQRVLFRSHPARGEESFSVVIGRAPLPHSSDRATHEDLADSGS